MGVAYAPGLPPDFNMSGPNSYRHREATALFADVLHTFNDLFSMRLSYSDGQSHNNRQTQFPVFVAGAGQLTFETAQDRSAKIDKIAFYADTDTWDRMFRLDLNYIQEFDWVKLSAAAGAERRTTSSNAASYRNMALPQFPLYDPQPSDYELGTFPINYGPQQVNRNDGEDDQFNLVGSAQFFNQRLSVLGGVSRTVQKYDKLDRADSRPTGSGPLFQIAPNLKQPNNYAAGATFEFLPGIHAFYSYSESSLTPSANFPNDPQSGKGTDFGVRVQRGRMSGSVTVFDVERVNIVRSDPTQPTGSAQFQVLSGKEESTGWEAEVFWFPTDELQIMANYTDMEPIVVKNTQAPITEGRTIDGAYPQTFNLFAKYSPAKGVLAGWFFSAGVNYYSKTLPFGTNEALTLLENPAYTLWQAGFGYRWRTNRGQWVAGIHGNNLTDEFYYNDAAKNGQGRVITGTLTWRY
jgi:outer membrane receptor for monomeric catechols